MKLLKNVEQRPDKSGVLGLTRREDFKFPFVQPDPLASRALVNGHVVALLGYQRRAIARTLITLRRDLRCPLGVGSRPQLLLQVGVDPGEILFFVAAGL